MKVLLWPLTLLMAIVPALAQTRPESPVHRMNDGFAYQIVDFGLGTLPYPFEPVVLRRQAFGSPTEKSALWIKLKITNLSERQLGLPRYSSMSGAVDDALNEYSLQHQAITRVAAGSGRYKPGESSLELALIPASELIDGIKELRVVLGDTGGFGRSFKFFLFKSPQSRRLDFDPRAVEPDPSTLAVEARSAFLPPIPERR